MKATKRRRSEQVRLKRGEVITRMATLDGGRVEFDEVVAYNCTVHLEKMDTNEFALMVYGRRETVCYMIGAKRAPVDGREWWRDRADKPKTKRRT